MQKSSPEKLAIEAAGPSKTQIAPGTSKSQAALPFLKTRMSPSALLHFVNNNLSEMQKTAIREMGFGGLLCLKTDMIPGQLAYWLVSSFNPFMSSLLDNQLPIRELDVHLTTGLPMGEVEIKQATKYEQSEMFLELVRAWKSQYDGVDKVKTSQIFDKMAEQRDDGEDFKRNFVVVVVSTFLMGVKGTYPSLCILKCLSDVSIIPKLKWCDFTQKNITTSVMQWRDEKAKEEKGCPKKIYKGPIMVLILIYLDRVVFMGRTVDRVFPTLCTWTKQAISARVSKEKKEAKCFGAGFVDGQLDKKDCIVYADYVEGNLTTPNNDNVIPDVIDNENHAASENDDHSGHPDNRTSVSACIEKIADAGKVLAHAFEYFAETIYGAKSVMPHSVVVGQLSELADAFHGRFTLTPPCKPEEGGLTKTKRDKVAAAVGLTDTCTDTAGAVRGDQVGAETFRRSLRRSVQSSVTAEAEPVNVTASTGIDDDPCWNDPTFLAAVCALSNAFNKEPPAEPTPKKRRVAPDYPTFNLFGSQNSSGCVGSHILQDKDMSAMIGVSPSPVQASDSPIKVAHPDPKETKPRIKRDIIVSDVFKSPFVQRNISLLSDLSQAEKDISDLVFGEGFDDSEVLFRNQHFQLRRFDLRSLVVTTKVESNVVNAWAHILNMKEAFKSASSPLRLYAFVTLGGLRCEDTCDYDNLKLMFFPFALRDPFLICVNFITRKIQVIHPMRPRSLVFTESVQHVRTFIKRAMTAKSRIFERVQFFSYEEFVPKSQPIVDVDDGIYLMYYMETYFGDRTAFKTDTVNAKPSDKALFKMRLKYCSAIVTCDHNELKDQVVLEARRLSVKIGKQAVDKDPCYSDDQLLHYVFRPSKGDEANFDIVVQTKYGCATRHAMATLKPRKWVMDMVIDMFGIYSMLLSPELLYVPTTARLLNPARDKTLGRKYINMSYMPTDGMSVKAIFIPLFRNEHWFLCVCDLELKTTYFLNSLHTNKRNDEMEFAADVVSNVIDILVRSEGYKHLIGVPLNTVEDVSVPEQTNCYDCGVYLLKWLEAGRDASLWTSKSYYKNMAAYRKQVAVKLL